SEMSRSNESLRICASAVVGSCADTNCRSGASSNSARNVQVSGSSSTRRIRGMCGPRRMSRRDPYRKLDHEDRTGKLIACGNRTSMHSHNLADDGEPESRALTLGLGRDPWI